MAAVREEFQPHMLFVHRDAEAQDPELRHREIPDVGLALVRVVPVRMTEAWLLFAEAPIRRAAGRPGGGPPLELPAMSRVEELPDPKSRLRELLVLAAAARGRRLVQLRRDLPAAVHRVAELIEDFSPLRQLPAFARFERDCRSVYRQHGSRQQPG